MVVDILGVLINEVGVDSLQYDTVPAFRRFKVVAT